MAAIKRIIGMMIAQLVMAAMLLAAMTLPFVSVRRVAGGMIRAFQRMELAAGLGILFALINAAATILILRAGFGILELMLLGVVMSALRASTFSPR